MNPGTRTLLLATLLAAGAGTAHASADLAKTRNCVACHAADRKLVGPAFKDIAAKYANDKDASVRLTKKVREGGTGVWGQVPMPANPQVSPEEATTLVKWILSHK